MDDDGGGGARKRGASSSSSNAAAYPAGAVKRVRVHNFMTYTGTVTITPGPRLNLVLGPNGTGKSSLVCALCIGLGGPPKLLGRADNLKDYVQRGATEAWTEITLSGGGAPGARDTVVRRDIRQTQREEDGATVTGYASKWRINDRDATNAQVADLVAGLNIQFDNLCQFLPQDRVVEFARMDAHELLAATQKAIGDARLHAQHQRLVELSADARTKRTSLASQRASLARKEAENAALERDAERHRRRAALQRSVDEVRCKEAWLEVEAQQAKVAEDERALERANQLVQDVTDAGAALGDGAAASSALKAAKQRVQAAEQQQRALAPPDTPAAFAATSRDLRRRANALVEEVSALESRIVGLADRRREQRRAVAALEADVEAKRRAFAALPPPVNNQDAIRRANEARAALADAHHELAAQQRALEFQQQDLSARIARDKARLARLAGARYRRLAALEHRMPGVTAAHEWVEARKRGGAFRGPVHGPLGAEMAAAGHANVVEAASGAVLLDFAVTCREDEEAVSEELRRRGLYARVVVCDRPLNAPYLEPAGPASAYERFGVAGTVADLVQAPPLVMQALTSGHAALGGSLLLRDEARLDDLLDQPRVRTVYTPSQEHRVIRSAYGGARDAARQSFDLRPPHVLGGAEEAAAGDAARKELQQRVAAAEAELAGINEQLARQAAQVERARRQQAECDARLQALVEEQRASTVRRTSAKRALDVLELQLKAKRAEPDPLAARPQLEAQRADAFARLHETTLELLRLVRRQWEGAVDRGATALAGREAEMQLRALEGASQEHKHRLAQAKETAQRVQRLYQKSRAQLVSLRRRAEAEAPIEGSGAEVARMKRALAALPSDAEALRELRERYEREMGSIVCNNPGAQEEYETRKREIADLTAKVALEEGALAAIEAEIATTKAAWLPELERVIGTVNAAFGAAFGEIGCAGEVVLDTAGGGDDFAKYAARVMVKFRDGEDLQPLTGTRQSGGERSVATILYLLALQGVTVTPFRVVDEINQGMDPVNERKVFDRLVAAATREGTPQCFLLTPKLLPDLEYGRDVTVLQIINGVIEGAGPAGWDLAALVGSARQRRAGGGGGAAAGGSGLVAARG